MHKKWLTNNSKLRIRSWKIKLRYLQAGLLRLKPYINKRQIISSKLSKKWKKNTTRQCKEAFNKKKQYWCKLTNSRQKRRKKRLPKLSSEKTNKKRDTAAKETAPPKAQRDQAKTLPTSSSQNSKTPQPKSS